MSASATAARRGAVALLDQVLGQQRMLSDAVASGTLEDLSPPDRARAQRLAADTLRGLERADRLLQQHLQRQPPLTVRNALRLGTVEMCHGAAAHGVVNAMVQIIGNHRKHRSMRGLVNAVLRRISETAPEKWDSLRIPRLPKWLRSRLVQAWGAEATGRIEAAHYAGAALDLTPRAEPAALADSLGETLEANVLPTGSVRLGGSPQVSALPGYAEGAWWVQDAAAALAARALATTPGEAVLDLCAAPGGKTLQLAATGADVTAVDISAGRLAVLYENLARVGMKARVEAADGLSWSGSYDAILLDAPCSATGTIRRHPDLPYLRDGAGLAELTALQMRMLDHAWSLLRPGGRFVFCTCSLLPEEGEAQIAAALTRHGDMALDTAALALPGVAPGWIDPEAGLRLRPDYWPKTGGMDGFFIAALRKLP